MLIGQDIARTLDPVLFALDCGITPDPWQADLLRSTAQRSLLLCSRQSGKTETTAIKGLHHAFYTPNSTTVIVSPSQRQSAEMLRRVRDLHNRLEGAPTLGTESVLKIELANRSRILALPGTERTIRGLAATLVIVDEAARVEDELLAAVRPMLATTNGSLICLTTPAGKRGFFYEAWHGDDSWHRVRVSAEDCPRISKEFLAEELRELGPTRFSEEYGLAWVDASEMAFPTTIIDQAFTTEVLPLW